MKINSLSILVGVSALTIFLLSAIMNGFTGYQFGNLLNVYAAYFAMALMLVTELVAPTAMIVKRKTDQVSLFTIIALVMAFGLSIFSFWNGSLQALTKGYADLALVQNKSVELKLKGEKVELSTQGNTITKEQEIEPYRRSLSRIKNRLAKNLAGQQAFSKDGVKLTIWTATNYCTGGSGDGEIYYKTIYPNQCNQIKALQRKIATIQNSNQQIVRNRKQAVENLDTKLELNEEQGKNKQKEYAMLPFVTQLVAYVGNDEDEIKYNLSKIAIYLAVFSEILRLSLIAMFVSTLTTVVSRKENFVVRLINDYQDKKLRIVESAAIEKAKRKAELEHEDEKQSREPVIFNPVDYLKEITYDQLCNLYNPEQYFLTKKSDQRQNEMILLFTVWQYEPNKQLVINKTIDDICEMVEDSNHKGVKAAIKSFNGNHADLIQLTCGVVKPHRLRNVIYPALFNAGLVTKVESAGKEIFTWVSEDKVVDLFSKILK